MLIDSVRDLTGIAISKWISYIWISFYFRGFDVNNLVSEEIVLYVYSPLVDMVAASIKLFGTKYGTEDRYYGAVKELLFVYNSSKRWNTIFLF